MISIEKLNKIKNEYKIPQATKILVRLGICGASVGAKEVYKTFVEEVKRLKLKDVVVIPTGCIGLCSQEPLVDIITPGMPPVTYTFVTPEKAKGIMFHHILNKEIISEWVIPKML